MMVSQRLIDIGEHLLGDLKLSMDTLSSSRHVFSAFSNPK